MLNDAPILLDVSRLIWRRWKGRHPTGIDRVCLAYLHHFRADAQAVVQYGSVRRILDRQASDRLFAVLGGPTKGFRRRLITAILRFGARRSMPGKSRQYLNVGHTGLDDPGLRSWVRSADVRPIYFVHDLIPITHPDLVRAGEEGKHRRRMATVLSTAAGVIANSNSTIAELGAFARSEGLPLPRTVAAKLGSEAASKSSHLGAPARPPYFVILGTIEARKNHLMLLQVWLRLIEELGAEAPRLLVIGQRGWECEDVFQLLDDNETLRQAVVEISDCDDKTLNLYLSGATALLFPSLVEGYGMPLVEALRAAVPVIASDLPVFREIAGTIPDYLDPLDAPAWERSILSYSERDSTARSLQVRRMQDFEAPTWENHFTIVDAWRSKIGSAESFVANPSANIDTADSLANPPRTRQRSTRTRRKSW